MVDAAQLASARLQQVQSTVESRLQTISAATGRKFSLYFERAVQRAEPQVVTAEPQIEQTAADPLMSSGSRITQTGRSEIDELILQASERYGVSAGLIDALMWAESGYRAEAVSPKGAMGLMQLMPATAAGLGVEDPFDPGQNVDGGVRLLAALLEKYNGDAKMAVAAYNCGAAGLNKRGITALDSEQQLALLPAETRTHLERIEAYLRENYSQAASL